MEILNSGSFISLDNREKIEQLIFTARTLASEVSRNEGFQGSGQSNQQIGLELWKGAEYMTRSHEEVTIRNIFLSKFLERLRQIEREPTPRMSVPAVPVNPTEAGIVSSDSATPPATQIGIESTAAATSRDEFLGVVEDEAGIRPSYSNECVPECEEEIASILRASGTSSVGGVTDNSELEKNQIAESKEDIETAKTGADQPVQTISSVDAIDVTPEVQEDILPVEKSEDPVTGEGRPREQPVQSVVLSEQEPYNFDSCTVTAVIQLLPETNGLRDFIISIRSHDFAPQITFANTPEERGRPDFAAQLSTALEQYRTILPTLAAEKMKKEKSSTKKRASKTTEKNSRTTFDKADTNAQATSNPNTAVQEQAKDQRTLFAS